MSEKKVVLISGASSGIGQATARLLAQRDFTVFGTARNPSGVEAMPAWKCYLWMCVWMSQ